MLSEANDFLEECDALAEILKNVDDRTLQTVTLFKSWTIEDVIAHLHMWNIAAGLTLKSREAFHAFFAGIAKDLMAGKTHPQTQRAWLDKTQNGLRGLALLKAWREFYPGLAEKYLNADPEIRLAWAGPDMNAKSKIIARQMEIWAHGQEIFDALGIVRVDTDRIRNIAHLGVTTYSWSFRNRGEEPPSPKPCVSLIAPSGAIWEWNEPQQGNCVEGSAVEFSQVVTQTRNIADTSLKTKGEAATRWMAIAQCFAGAAETPPAKGARYTAKQ